MSSAITTSLPLPIGQGIATYVAEVIDADATATGYVLNCPPEVTTDCGVYNVTVTVGPWASKTLPPGAASTGEFDLHLSIGANPDDEGYFELSFHCDMTRSVADKCVTTNIGGNNDGTPVATLTNTRYLAAYGLDTFSWAPVSITAGQELLAATQAASNKATATGDASGEATATGSSATPTASKDSGAASCLARVFTAMSVAGLAISIVLS